MKIAIFALALFAAAAVQAAPEEPCDYLTSGCVIKKQYLEVDINTILEEEPLAGYMWNNGFLWNDWFKGVA